MTEEQVQQAIDEVNSNISELSFLNDTGQHDEILEDLNIQLSFLIDQRNSFHQVFDDEGEYIGVFKQIWENEKNANIDDFNLGLEELD